MKVLSFCGPSFFSPRVASVEIFYANRRTNPLTSCFDIASVSSSVISHGSFLWMAWGFFFAGCFFFSGCTDLEDCARDLCGTCFAASSCFGGDLGGMSSS
jgi:hypothetical protein